MYLHPPDLLQQEDALLMRQALDEATRGLGRTSPNPAVGCVIVRGGEIVGRGFHPGAGEPHAEVFALRGAGERARGATVYVTLEPCAHFGRTPPCADALIAAGVRRVVVAACDPNPQVAGRGVAKLRAAGLEVTLGVLEEGALAQQAGFRSLVVRGRPWVVYKFAATLDGKVAAMSGDSRWVSAPGARQLVHAWRGELDAVAVGSGTVLADDPSLTTRGVEDARDARRIVFDRRGRVSPGARALGAGSVLVTGSGTDPGPYETAGVTVIRADALPHALAELARLNVSSLLLEGGPALAAAFFAADLIDEVRAFLAPKLLGAGLSPLSGPAREHISEARELFGVQTEQVGPDLLVRGLLHPVPVLSLPALAAPQLVALEE